ncbi:hypothetical protein N0P75_08640 [Citrobacter youngae]|uniref:hypothetical protein n=1 Tax=Citrobacter TaxID=544 RepID=UPI0017F5BCE7|nr:MULTISPECIES: hypothetical protein [Citrobacter]MBA7968563.1 hypothetical protein [Citrobacter sp. RHBSTW-00671]MBJ9109985.1 hypothetical protein [Citrobacter sp. FDAARGOS_156]MBJ9156758.1 hypothetical protein [Citrobacter sp. FDAARGOS_156]MBJ9202177.1 hypothetical protein [Citrobacter sp. FDAARGOS_156]MBK6259083.1 hypothetical protein [Citrobacter youngae]
MRKGIFGKVLRQYTDAVAAHVDTHLEQTDRYRLTVDANGNATLNTENPDVQADIIRKMKHLRKLHNRANKDVA